MGGILSSADFLRLIGRSGGDIAKARQVAAEQGYTGVEGGETWGADGMAAAPEDETADVGETGGALPGTVGSLQALLGEERTSIKNLYDDITKNIEKRYRAPDFNDLLVNIGVGMLTPPGEYDEGGFRGAMQRGLQGVGKYALERRAYEKDMNKMMSDLEIEKAKTLAGLQGKYLTSAASLLKPKDPFAGAVWDPDNQRWVFRPGSAGAPQVLTPEQVAELSRDPKNRGMKFYTTDGRPMEIK